MKVEGEQLSFSEAACGQLLNDNMPFGHDNIDINVDSHPSLQRRQRKRLHNGTFC